MPREVVVNARFLSRSVTGVERYGREILSFIGDNCRLEKNRVNGLRGHFWEQFFLPARVNAQSILWSPANTGPLMVRNQALTIHDLSPLEHPEWFRTSFAAWYRLLLPILAKRVRAIFTPSEHVKRKVLARFGVQNVIVTPNGVNRCVFHAEARQNKYDLPCHYILFLGTLEPRKNLPALLRAWADIKKDFKDTWLIVAGGSGRVFRPLQLDENSERVRFLDRVEEEQLPGLYAGASLFVLPSFDEGFGLPAIEAMACGTPVIVSDRGAMPEVVGDAAYVFELLKPGSLADAITSCLMNESLQAALSERGLTRAQAFSWQRTAESIWNTLHEI